MSLEEFYGTMDQSYEEVLGRLAGNEDLLKKFLKKFLSDSSYSRIMAAKDAKDYDELFVGVHTFKGVTANLGLKTLAELSVLIMAELRDNRYEKIQGLCEQLTDEYKRINEFFSENPDCLPY